MPLLDIVVTVVSSLFCAGVGVYFAGIPLQAKAMTDRQNTTQQILSVICFGLVIILFFLKQNVTSWAVIFAMCFGMCVGKIPPIHRYLLAKFPDIFLAKNDPNRTRKTTGAAPIKTDEKSRKR